MILNILSRKFTVNKLVFCILSSLFLLALSNPNFSHKDTNTLWYLLKYVISYFFIFFFSCLFIANSVIFKIYVFQAFLITIISSYYQSRYGFTINTELVQSLFETNIDEVIIMLLDCQLLIILLLIVIVGLFLFCRVSLTKLNKKYFIGVLLIQIAIILTIKFFNYTYLRSFIKEYGTVVSPINFYSITNKYVRNKIRYRDVVLDYTLYNKLEKLSSKDELNIVLVIGESARSANFSLNGYTRNTNPLLSKQNNLVSYQDATSCGTSTAFAVPCILSRKGRESNFKLPSSEPSIIYAFKKLGFNTSFYSMQNIVNNVAIHKICMEADVCDYNLGNFDSILIDKLKNNITSSRRNFIVLHMNGSHFLYHERYPSNYKSFTPDCKQTAYLCNRNDAINSYDNSILYTDFVLNELIKTLSRTKSMMIFTSDHGESIGENGHYGHASLFAIAPKEQVNVPFIIWMSDNFPDREANIASTKHHIKVTHDYIFHTLLCLVEKGDILCDKRLNIFDKKTQ